jgi:hypothetical protein
VRDYSEQQQDAVYQATLDAARGRAAGVLAWTLRDYDAGPTSRWETREEHYGLFRPDGSLKPAAARLRDYAALAPLPSLPKAAIPLSSSLRGPPSGADAPLLVAAGGHYVKGEFRLLWDAINGRYNLGLPVSEAFVRAKDYRVVQYFTGAVAELHPEAREDPAFAQLPPDEQLRRLIRFVNIGSVYTDGRSFPAQQGVDHDPGYYAPETGYAVDPAFRRYYDGLGGRWRFGAAISGKVDEQVDGVSMPVQYFQNGRLQRNPATQATEVGALGSWAWGIQCAYVQ